ncbi:MAG: 3-hydroxyacyl-CoA dehydrogenase NAD-binding domain-containing protein [Trueperaceae bacterium]|nr:3-hydroxyacyl-CoA dehydrogenase NAD-binding domain-containing protein [Trueperaceae bacterium]
MNVSVLGAGTMGAGIAQACATAGHAVTLFDAAEGAASAAHERVRSALDRQAEKGRMSPGEAADAAERITVETRGLADAVASADAVIEAVVEDDEVKRRVWAEVGQGAPRKALLCTNTSSLSVTALGTASGRPEALCGLHFFVPAPIMPLVEVVRGEATTGDTLARAERLAESLGKTPVRCEDRPGFLVNRLLIPYLNEAATLADEGTSTPDDVDRAMTLGANMPIGPLALADMVGLDVVLSVMESLHREFGDPRYRPAPVLRRMVRAGHLGRKRGRGFFEYGGT